MTAPSEAQLVAKVQQGDRAALGDLLEHYQHRLYNVCLRMVSNRDDAAELTQDTLLKIIEHIGDYNGQCAISTWMIRIAMNLSISHLRKRKLRQAASLDQEAKNNGGDQSAALRDQLADSREPDPAQSVQQHEMVRHLHKALAHLEDDFRAVLVLRDIDELDYQEIAEVLGVPVGTVKSRIFRARLALREHMLQLCPASRSAATRLGEGVGNG